MEEEDKQDGFVRVDRRGVDSTTFVLGYMLEALRLEIRAASRRRDGDDAMADYYEGCADSAASLASPAFENPLIRKEHA